MHSLDIRRAAEAAAGDLEHCALAELCAVAVCPAYACRAEQFAVGIGDQAALRSGTVGAVEVDQGRKLRVGNSGAITASVGQARSTWPRNNGGCGN